MKIFVIVPGNQRVEFRLEKCCAIFRQAFFYLQINFRAEDFCATSRRRNCQGESDVAESDHSDSQDKSPPVRRCVHRQKVV